MTDIVKIQEEINLQLANKEVFNALVNTTFKGLNQNLIKRAVMEGMMRGFTFKDFLEKNVYAIPFKDGYSLVTSIDYARKVGMRSDVIGKSAPIYTYTEDKKTESCTITIKRMLSGVVGEYTATVFFDEYNTGKQQWASKPKTMIAKVAEMHALRMACPEELSQAYSEDEMHESIPDKPEINIDEFKTKLEAVKTVDELKTVWASLPVEAKNELEALKNELKEKLI